MSDEETPKAARSYKKSTIITVGSQKPKADKTRHYVDNDAFYAALVERREQMKAHVPGTPPPRISNFIGECVLKIARKLSSLHYFNGKYSYSDEMIDRAVENCIRKIDKFDVDETKNPFSYFTQICYYSFISTIEEEKKNCYIKFRSLMDALSDPDMIRDIGAESSGDGEHTHDNMSFDVSETEKFVAAFEKKRNIRHTGTTQRSKKAVGRSPVEDLFGEAPEAPESFPPEIETLAQSHIVSLNEDFASEVDSPEPEEFLEDHHTRFSNGQIVEDSIFDEDVE